MLENILPLFETLGISERERAFGGYAETYNVEVADIESLSDSLFLVKGNIIDLFSDLLPEKRGFKYVLSAIITLKRWNNAINWYNIENIYLNSEARTVTNQRFNLDTSYEKLKYILNIWSSEGSGWIVDKIEAIHIKICNYDPLSGSSHITLPPELNNSMKGLINLKNKNVE